MNQEAEQHAGADHAQAVPAGPWLALTWGSPVPRWSYVSKHCVCPCRPKHCLGPSSFCSLSLSCLFPSLLTSPGFAFLLCNLLLLLLSKLPLGWALQSPSTWPAFGNLVHSPPLPVPHPQASRAPIYDARLRSSCYSKFLLVFASLHPAALVLQHSVLLPLEPGAWSLPVQSPSSFF
ncbi:hypothetical protein M758_7G134900 [Ceratodon purpureus]|nr:hypothetical protein M758_7G134900 [Ceratodon purpureus]